MYPPPPNPPPTGDISTWAQYPADDNVVIPNDFTLTASSGTIGTLNATNLSTQLVQFTSTGGATSSLALTGPAGAAGTLQTASSIQTTGSLQTGGNITTPGIAMTGTTPVISNLSQLNFKTGGALTNVSSINGTSFPTGTIVTTPMTQSLDGGAQTITNVTSLNGVTLPSTTGGQFLTTPLLVNVDGSSRDITNLLRLGVTDLSAQSVLLGTTSQSGSIQFQTANAGGFTQITNLDSINGVSTKRLVSPPAGCAFLTTPMLQDLDASNFGVSSVGTLTANTGNFSTVQAFSGATIGRSSAPGSPILNFASTTPHQGSITNLKSINGVDVPAANTGVSFALNPAVASLNMNSNNLTNVGTVNGIAPSSWLRSPLTADLSAGNNKLTNISEVSCVALKPSGNLTFQAGGCSIGALGSLVFDAAGSGDITNVKTINGASYPPSTAGFVTNPLSTDLAGDSKNITNVGTVNATTLQAQNCNASIFSGSGTTASMVNMSDITMGAQGQGLLNRVKTIQMNNGAITGLSTINGQAYPPTIPSNKTKFVYTGATQIYTVPGTANDNVQVDVFMVGGGGGGGYGGSSTVNLLNFGAGGGGGGSGRTLVTGFGATGTIPSLIMKGATTISVNVGAPGAGGIASPTSPTAATNGGATTITPVNGTVITAAGGFAGGGGGSPNGGFGPPGAGGAGGFGGGGGGQGNSFGSGGTGGVGDFGDGQNGDIVLGHGGNAGGGFPTATGGILDANVGGGGGGGSGGGYGANAVTSVGGPALNYGAGGGGGSAVVGPSVNPIAGFNGGNGAGGCVIFTAWIIN